jgi:CRP/FNR family cyclic AMP-dependent transcriptional regulator
MGIQGISGWGFSVGAVNFRQDPRGAALWNGRRAMRLDSVTVLNGMTTEGLGRLEQNSLRLDPRDGTTVFAEGDRADSVYAIIAGDGHIRIGTVDRNGKALMVEVLRAGDIFGEIGVIDGGFRSASAVVEGRVHLAKIPAALFSVVLANEPALGAGLCRMMAQRLRRTYELFQDAALETLQVRLARQILYLAAQDGRQTPQGLRLAQRFRQADLADLLGATTRSIITILNTWRAANLIFYDTDRALLTVQDIPALQAIVEQNRER